MRVSVRVTVVIVYSVMRVHMHGLIVTIDSARIDYAGAEVAEVCGRALAGVIAD